MKIDIYSKTDCPSCHLAKIYMHEHAIAFTEHVYDNDSDRQAMYDRLQLEGWQRTVPQIIVWENDGQMERIGGYNELRKSDLVARCSIGDFNAEF